LFHAAPPAVNDSGDEFCNDSQRNLRGKYVECIRLLLGIGGRRGDIEESWGCAVLAHFYRRQRTPGGFLPSGHFFGGLWGCQGRSLAFPIPPSPV
jgi:hypothetical protein